MELKLDGFGRKKNTCLFGYDMFSKSNALYVVGYTSHNTKMFDLKKLEDKLINDMGEKQAREFAREMHEKLKLVDEILKEKRDVLIHKDGRDQQAAQDFFDKLYRVRRKNFVAEVDYILELMGKGGRPALSRNFNTLESIRELMKGWFNGENAFSDELVNRVARVVTILSRLKNQPEVFPTGRNSIQIEFEKSNGDYLEFEFFEDGKISKYYSDSIKSYSRNVSEKNIFKSVKEFYDN